MPDEKPAVAHPSATVILLRDSKDGCETLLVLRNARLAFHGGAWVFPGGRIDAEDRAAAGSDDVLAAAKRAAVREAREETGLAVRSEELVLISRWITPELLPKRFDTWFFAAPATAGQVRVDGGEIQDHRWIRPADALAAQRAGELKIPAPTYVTLLGIVTYRAAHEALGELAHRRVETFFPRVHMIEGGACTLYPGDIAYDDGQLERPGPRHRLIMSGSGWRYERST